MPQAAVIAAALTDHSAHPFSLWVNSFDVIRQPGTAGNLYGTPLESISVTETGPGGVSSMTFLIEDPGDTLYSVGEAEILFVDNTTGVTLFRGYVDGESPTPRLGGIGRTISVSCTGLEAWLDWSRLVVDTDVGSLINLNLAIVKVANGFSILNSRTSNVSNGDATNPVGQLDLLGVIPFAVASASLVTAGTTLREAINIAASQASYHYIGSTPPAAVFATVDFNFGLRAWPNDSSMQQPSDYTTLTITDTPAGVISAAGLTTTTDYMAAAHTVMVLGSAAANNLTVSDGAGISRRVDLISQPLATTPALALQYGQQYLATQNQPTRGSLSILDWTPTATVHAGSLVSITDATLNLAGRIYRIMEIQKTFHGNGRQDWSVSFGGLRPSAMRLTRRLTRTLS